MTSLHGFYLLSHLLTNGPLLDASRRRGLLSFDVQEVQKAVTCYAVQFRRLPGAHMIFLRQQVESIGNNESNIFVSPLSLLRGDLRDDFALEKRFTWKQS